MGYLTSLWSFLHFYLEIISIPLRTIKQDNRELGEMTHSVTPLPHKHGGLSSRAHIKEVGMMANICNTSSEKVEEGRFHPWGPLARHLHLVSNPQVP